ncbi:LysR family transcriptional regulator [Pseudonocardia spinosispora]|uniref:LysR family transcriptional regulator n=1 Tax=Pseudonocardia spinosispora TaxID=103441 RepID=UPI0003FC9EEF|nr:LysR family transcriptional regulator [Pseudonocardia spinosispora]
MAEADIELRHLRAFISVARHSSFTRAAEELVISQPGLSRTIRQLESTLHVQLLDRSSRHVELTEVGAVFLGHAERVLGELDQAFAVVRAQSSIRLGFSWLLPHPWAQHSVDRFEQATGCKVNLVRIDDPLAAVLQNKIDVALVRGRVESPMVRMVHLFDEPRVAVCSNRSALAGKEELSWSEVPDWPLVVNIVSGTTGPWCWPDGDGPETVVETTNFDEWIESVAADRGIGVVSDEAQHRAIHPGVTFVPLRGAPPIPVSLAFLPGVQESLMRRFVQSALAT